MKKTENEIPVVTVILQMAIPYGYWHITDAEGNVHEGRNYLTQDATVQGLLQALRKIYEESTAR